MKMILLSLFIFVNTLGSLAQEDLRKKAFVFPTESNTAHVILQTTHTLQESLTSFTVCLRSYTELTRAQGIFSYATKRYDNEILLFKASSNQYDIWVGNECVSFIVPGTLTLNLSWQHICTSWESATGLVTFWLNGQAFPRKILRKGFSISPEAFILLGQEQDAFGGGFDVQQSFVGEIEDVYMTNRVLSSREVNLFYFSGILPSAPYLMNWMSLSFGIQGDVLVEPSLLLPTIWTRESLLGKSSSGN